MNYNVDVEYQNETRRMIVVVEENRTRAEELYDNVEPIAKWSKVFIQMVIGVLTVAGIFFMLYLSISKDTLTNKNELTTISRNLFQIISIGLGIATGVELSYMLFTDGPDEVIQPVSMSLATFVIYQLSKNDNISAGKGVGIFIIVILIPILLYTSFLYERSRMGNRTGRR